MPGLSGFVHRDDLSGERFDSAKGLHLALSSVKTPFFMKTARLLPLLAILLVSSCSTTEKKISKWEGKGNQAALSKVARQSSETPQLRRKALESLARLDWKPTNQERLEIYSLIASEQGREEAVTVTKQVSQEDFGIINGDILASCALLSEDGKWSDRAKATELYGRLKAANKKAVSMILCQETISRPDMRTRVLLLAIKLGIEGSEADLNAVLKEYGDKPMAEDYLNSGSDQLHEGGVVWANSHGYRVASGQGSHRSAWGRF